MVYSFEPNPWCYRILNKRFAHLGNVKVHNVGLMDRRCSLTLRTPLAHDEYDDLDTTVASTVVTTPSDDQPMRSAEVECIDLAEFIDELGEPVTLLKMDIEGAEIAVLNHLIDTGAIDRVRLAVVETHERFSPELAQATETLRERLRVNRLDGKIRLDWI
jgi:FkbM family methyltransferase